eukprot:TRINITY_DN6027_c0_g1_i8.p1 TRINITY_DN6027_c0_g1~~TRINITY_DN6027_c0_g1_i8.p1  ORF type:complete len:691 (+),score=155.68 TRINITY_DN6027_c0_g1_i8:111-2183(+)
MRRGEFGRGNAIGDENPHDAERKQSYARDLEEQIRMKRMQKEKEREELRRLDEKYEAEWRSNQQSLNPSQERAPPNRGSAPSMQAQAQRPASPSRRPNNFYAKNSGPPPFGTDASQQHANPIRSQNPPSNSHASYSVQRPIDYAPSQDNQGPSQQPMYPFGMQATLQFPPPLFTADAYGNPSGNIHPSEMPAFPLYQPPIYGYGDAMGQQISAYAPEQPAHRQVEPPQIQSAMQVNRPSAAAPMASVAQASSRGKSQYQLELEAQIREKEMRKQKEKEERLLQERREEEDVQRYWQGKDALSANANKPHPSQQSIPQQQQPMLRRGTSPTPIQVDQRTPGNGPAQQRLPQTAPEEPRFARFRTDPNRQDDGKSARSQAQADYQNYLRQQIEEKQRAKEEEKRRLQMEEQMEEARFYEQKKAEKDAQQRPPMGNREEGYMPSTGKPTPGSRSNSPRPVHNAQAPDAPESKYRREVGRSNEPSAPPSHQPQIDARLRRDPAMQANANPGGNANAAHGENPGGPLSTRSNPLDEWHHLRKELESENDRFRQRIAQSRAVVNQTRQQLMQPPPSIGYDHDYSREEQSIELDEPPRLLPGNTNPAESHTLDLHPLLRHGKTAIGEDKSLVADSTFVYPEETEPTPPRVRQQSRVTSARSGRLSSIPDEPESPMRFPVRSRSRNKLRWSGDEPDGE